MAKRPRRGTRGIRRAGMALFVIMGVAGWLTGFKREEEGWDLGGEGEGIEVTGSLPRGEYTTYFLVAVYRG